MPDELVLQRQLPWHLKMSADTTPFRSLTLSLLPDPFYQAITVDVANSKEAQLAMLDRYFEYSMDEAQRTGRTVLAEPAHLGGTAWLLPRTENADALESSAKHAFLTKTLGPAGYENYCRIIDFMAPRAAKHVSAEAWYLSIVGVHPGAQGKGLGELLLRPTLQEATGSGICCYLETFTPQNVRFYNRLGFVSVGEYLEPVTNSTYNIMRRDP